MGNARLTSNLGEHRVSDHDWSKLRLLILWAGAASD
jgi:hypothetical protein